MLLWTLRCVCLFQLVENHLFLNASIYRIISKAPKFFVRMNERGREKRRKGGKKKKERKRETKCWNLEMLVKPHVDGCWGWRSSCDSGLEGRQVSENTVTPFPGDCVTAFSGKGHPLNDLASKPLRTINGFSLLGWKKTCSSLLSSYFWTSFSFNSFLQWDAKSGLIPEARVINSSPFAQNFSHYGLPLWLSW